MQLRRSRPEDEPGTKAPKHSTAPSEETARYPRPKILVVDAPEVCEALQQNGYAATQGTFGQPLTIEKGMGYISPPSSMDLPGHTEQEIIIVDLAGPEPIPFETSSYEQPAPGVMAMWAPTADGLIDPRPLGMLNVRKDMDRIYRHGGVFILFASKRSGWGFALTYRRPTGDLEHVDARRFNADNWSLLSDLQWLTIVNDVGQEMLVAANGAAKKLGIDGFMSRGYFDCTIRPSGVTQGACKIGVL